MDAYLLQDWTTLRATGASTTLIQSEDEWINVENHGDLVFWLEVRNVQLGGATSVVLAYETGPSKEQALFSSMSTQTLAVAATPVITTILERVASVPPAAWIRWRLSLTGTPSTEWGATFRLHCVASRRRSG